jgi:hypothetical protein
MARPCLFQQQYSFRGQEFLKHNVIEDKTWIYHHTLESKWASMEWKHPGALTNREMQIVKSSMATVTLVMVTMFWDDKGVSVIVYMHKGKAINAASY